MARTSSHPVLDSHGNRVKNLTYRETASGRVYERWVYEGKGGRAVRRPLGEPGTIKTTAEAIRRHKTLGVKSEAARLTRGRRLESLTLGAAADRYFEMTAAFIERIETGATPANYKGVTSADTLALYRSNYENRIKPFFRKGSIVCSDVTAALCQQFFAHLRTQPGRTGSTLAEGTINSIKSTLSAILEEARVAGALDTDPLAGLTKRDRPTTTPRKSYRKIAVRQDVLFAIFDNTPDDYRRAIVGFAVFAGMRAGEIMGLKWEDIRLDVGPPHVWIAHSITKRRKRKGTKTGKERPFPLNAEMVETLRTHRAKERTRGLGADSDYIFTHPRRAEFYGNPMSVAVVPRALAEACKGLNLVDGRGEPIEAIDGRAARRSVATLLANEPSIPRHVSAGQMGHSVETAERQYVQKHHDGQEIEMIGLAIQRPPTLTLIEGGKEETA